MNRGHPASAFFRLVILFAAASVAVASPLGTRHSLTPDGNATATIGVMSHSDFVPDRVQPQQGQQIGLPDLLADRIAEHLAMSRRFQVVERQALRRLVLEQRFGQGLQQTYLDRTLDKAIDAMENVSGGGVVVTPQRGGPGTVPAGVGDVGTIGALSDFNDRLRDFKDLGAAAGADYLVMGDLEKLSRSVETTAVPYSTQGRTVQQKTADARLRFKVIDARNGTIAGAGSVRAKMVESVFEGIRTDADQYTFFDEFGRLAAAEILDITFPARIVSVDPLVISRGANEGVTQGDLFRVEREGKALKDANGVVIAYLRAPVGQLEVVAVQPTVSIVTGVAGAAFEIGDLVAAVEAPEPALQSAATVAAGPSTQSAGPSARPAGPVTLPRLAVGLVKSGSTAKTDQDANKHVPIFTDTMISRLTQTKRFQLIDRQEVDQLLTEQLAQAQVRNEGLPSVMGTLKGADYLVYGSLALLTVEDRETRLPNSNRIFSSKVGTVEGNMRIVDARSGDILESKKIIVEEKLDAGMDGKRVAVTLADAYAEQVVLMLMNAVYPIKVAHVGRDGTVYINRGDDGGLYRGEVLEAFRLGEAVVDPDTGIQFGQEEMPVGQVAVVEVEDAKSKGAVQQGGPVFKGDLLKRQLVNRGLRSATAETAQATRPVNTGGGWNQPSAPTRDLARSPLDKATVVMGQVRVNPSARTSGMAKGHIKRLSDELGLKLLNTGRFVMMERAEIDQVLDEKAFEAAAAGGDIADRLRELEGADYLIHGELTNFYLDVKKTQVPFVNRTETTVTRVADGVFRIVDVHAGRVVSAEKIGIRETVDEFDDANQIVGDLIDNFTTASVTAIVARLYPIKVLAMTPDGFVYLNRGSDGGVEIGSRYDVMRPGQEMIDPDTGRSFGAVEMNVGVLEVVSVEPNRSRAQLVSGHGARSGDVLRVAKAVPTAQPQPMFMQPAW
jgi:curli biogenesis system outer membrane secretion channel CsgG